MQFYILSGGQRKGPFTVEQLPAEGLERDSLVWYTGQPGWTRADQVPALAELMLTIPPPAPRQAAPPLETGGRLLPADWIRYDPRSYRSLYFWFVTLLCSSGLFVILGTILVIVAASHWSRPFRVPGAERQTVIGGIAIFVGVLLLLGAIVLSLVLLYKAWNQIQDGQARTSAEAAIGLLLVPFFNLFWVFVAVYGLAWDLHHYVVRRRLLGLHGLTPYPVSPGLALVCSIALVSAFVPIVDFVTFPIGLIIYAVLLGSVRSASMGIAAERLTQPPGWPTGPVAAPPEVEPQLLALPVDGRSEQVRRFGTE
jgi:hypothetical protein